ncbi:MAG: Gfo/Idh/MocA family oxidoreductase [Chloroflexi bacterium]|nr:Gfo/Idh/MocA family oxidoreductase [Chloroflexota bacterium]
MSKASQTIAVGVIGAGGMGGRHARNLHEKIAGAKVVAVMDADGARAQQVAAECDDAQVFTDAHQLIETATVDAVLIASPDRTHAGFVLECLRQQKQVLCEKPLAVTAADAQQIIAAELKLGRKFVQVGFMRHYDPQHVGVKRAIETGKIGRPVLFKGWHRNIAPDPNTTSAEIVTGSTIHDLDSARWLLGEEIEEVYVRGANTNPALGKDVWDLQIVQLTMSGGSLATIEVYVNATYGYEVGVEVVGTQGTALTGFTAPALIRNQLALTQTIEEDWLQRFDLAYITELQQWINSIQHGGQPTGPNTWDGYTSLLAAEACIESIRSGQPQRLEAQARPAFY